jgi:hypothetical protein
MCSSGLFLAGTDDVFKSTGLILDQSAEILTKAVFLLFFKAMKHAIALSLS